MKSASNDLQKVCNRFYGCFYIYQEGIRENKIILEFFQVGHKGWRRVEKSEESANFGQRYLRNQSTYRALTQLIRKPLTLCLHKARLIRVFGRFSLF